MSSRINFFFTEAIRSLSTNVSTSVAATLSMLVALLWVGVFLLVLFVVRGEATTIRKDAGRVQVFLNETATEADVNALRDRLGRQPTVERVEYVSKEDALERARKLFKENPEVLENLPTNPFPASLEARLSDPSKAETVAAAFKGEEGVESVRYGGEQGQKIVRNAGWVSAIAVIMAAFLVVAATMLVANTIRLSIFARRREIEVMKLVGASNSFVRVPFMIEGFLVGLIAATGAISIIWIVKRASAGILDSFKLSTGEPTPQIAIFCALLGMGVVLGSLGSGLTIRRYLRI